LVEKVHPTNKNTIALLAASDEIEVDGNARKTKCMSMPCAQNVGQ